MRLAAALVRVWVTFYTYGLPHEIRDARRREIASDLWESLHGGGTGSSAMSLVLRLVLGVADDVAWRREQPRHRRAGLVVMTISATVLLAMIWLLGRAAALPLPPLPAHVDWHARFDRPPPPPPPPPPCCR